MGVEVKKLMAGDIPAYFVNTKRGNALALTINVQVGSLHDKAGGYPGRAHLWEHIIHMGCRKYPRPEEFDRKMEELGIDYNAYTAIQRTFYYGILHPSILNQAIELLGSTLSEPLIDLESFEKEKNVVMNEVEEYRHSDSEALEAAIFLLLLSDKHPLKMYSGGLEEELKNTSVEHVREFYGTNYTPDTIQIIIAGNLSQWNDSKFQETIEALRSHFKFRKSAQPSDRFRTIPPLSKPSAVAPWGIELETKEEQYLVSLTIPMNEAVVLENVEMTELIFSALNQELDGSIWAALQSKAYLNNLSFGWHWVNNCHFCEIHFNLTKKGGEDWHQVLKDCFAEFHRILNQTPSDQVFRFLQESTLASFEVDLQVHQKAADFFGEYIDLIPNDEQIMNFHSRYGQLQKDSWKQLGNSIFCFEELLMGFIGPNVQGDHDFIGFNRRYKILDKEKLLAELVDLLKNGNAQTSQNGSLQLPAWQANRLEDLKNTSATESTLIHQRQGEAMLLEKQCDFSTGALAIRLKAFVDSVEKAVCLRLGAEIFYDQNRSLLSLLEGLEIFDQLRFEESQIQITLSGNAGQTLQAIKDLWPRISILHASADEFYRAKEAVLADIAEGEQAFSAHLALREFNDQLSKLRYSDRDQKSEIENLSVEKFNSLFKQIISRLDICISASGNFDESDMQTCLKSFAEVFPERLLPEEREWMNNSDIHFTKKNTVWKEISATKEESAYGVCWGVYGANQNTREYVYDLFLSSILNLKVFQLNRTQRELGYVHAADLSLHGEKSIFQFFGQTAGEDNLQLCLKGWKDVLENLMNEWDLLTEELYQLHQGFLRNRQMELNTDLQRAKRALYGFIYTGKPTRYNELTAIAEGWNFKNKEERGRLKARLASLQQSFPLSYQVFCGRKKPSFL